MREEAMIALQSLLTTALVGNFGFATAAQIDRRFKLWTEVDIQPALFIVQKAEDVRLQDRQPPVITMHLDLVLYIKSPADQITSSASVYNPILDALFIALNSTLAGELQTLSGTVYQCKIEGKIETDEGTQGDQGFVIIPLTIILLP